MKFLLFNHFFNLKPSNSILDQGKFNEDPDTEYNCNLIQFEGVSVNMAAMEQYQICWFLLNSRLALNPRPFTCEQGATTVPQNISQNKRKMSRSWGSDGRAVASDTRSPQFESIRQKIL